MKYIKMTNRLILLILLMIGLNLQAQIKMGAEQTEKYLPLLKGKNVGIVTNQSGLIGKTHLVDSLLHAGVQLKKIFSPEHGFRGEAEAGEKVNSATDPKSGLPVISLYGKNKKPSKEQFSGLDIVLFDIQDVGVRFYTYTSTLHYVMETCAEMNLPLIILDRPNPNGSYVDGNIPDMKKPSFVCMHPVPIVHGMTIGEYGKMINGEHWLHDSLQCKLTVIPCKNYNHTMEYTLPVAPSPNLSTQNAIYLYPSLCLFEGTIITVGRGTDYPFQIIGHPEYVIGSYLFVPEVKPGAAANPQFKGQTCLGISYINIGKEWKDSGKIHLDPLLRMYAFFKEKGNFFNDFFDTLAGGSLLREQIIQGLSEQDIRKSWEPGLTQFNLIRKKYLLY